jgi:hypothetical protein
MLYCNISRLKCCFIEIHLSHVYKSVRGNIRASSFSDNRSVN